MPVLPLRMLTIMPWPAADNRLDIVAEGGIQPLIALMQSANVEVQRQSTKAIANLAVNGK